MRRQTVRKLQRGAAALVVSGVVLWLVAVTASSPTAREAMTALGREGGLALALLESQLGRWEDPTAPFADNGVPARTLMPSSEAGYTVAGNVYINNRSDRTFGADIFDGTFSAALSKDEGPQVLILHTHGSEAYTPAPGTEVAFGHGIPGHRRGAGGGGPHRGPRHHPPRLPGVQRGL